MLKKEKMTTQIKYKNKPSEKVVKNYKKKLEKFLSAHKTTIMIDLWDNSFKTESSIKGYKIIEYFWVKDIHISTPEVKNLSVSVLSRGIDENIKDRAIWLDAGDIQSQLYINLGRYPKTPLPNNDPYWKLWDYLKEL